MDEVADISDVWRQAQKNHERWSSTGSREGDIRFHALGLSGEAGEVANFVKKRWRDGDGHDDDLRKEVADVCAYAFMLADALGMTPQELIDTIAQKQSAFILKMMSREAAREF
jgi:NTP pyrophosphatase (non-canonical NTP hydrolase)